MAPASERCVANVENRRNEDIRGWAWVKITRRLHHISDPLQIPHGSIGPVGRHSFCILRGVATVGTMISQILLPFLVL